MLISMYIYLTSSLLAKKSEVFILNRENIKKRETKFRSYTKKKHKNIKSSL